MSRPQIRVAAGVLQDAAGRFLAAQRPAGKIAAGKWEFPGGKIEAGESPEQALVRELQEELGVRVREMTPLIRISHAYTDRDVHMWVYRVSAWEGELQSCDGQALQWGTVAQLRALDLLGADGPILRALELPALLPITPADASLSENRQRAEAWWQRGISLARLRVPGVPDAEYVAAYQQLAGATRLGWIVDRSADMALDLGAAGYHATARMACGLQSRPVPESMLFGVSCHDAQSWAHALTLGADYALLSPVGATPTHPEAPALGWEQFARIVAHGSLPTYALGGVGEAEVAVARSLWGQGVSGIRAFS